MSSDVDALHKWIADGLKRARDDLGGEGREDEGYEDEDEDEGDEAFDEPSEIDRMVEIIEELPDRIGAVDPAHVEAVFLRQAVALDVMFSQFTKSARGEWDLFDKMRVALRAQSQCRATYKSLLQLQAPRGPKSKNSGERTIENEKTPA